jgi:cystathionine beta-lyase/cystathionine gamma-synthase
MKKPTRVTHQPEVELPEGNRSLVSPVYRSVKFTYPSIEAASSVEARARGFDYTRDSNPTTRQLELLCAELQDRDDAIVVATGMASIWLALLGNLGAGDRLLMFIESYRPSRIAVRRFLPKLGIEHSILSIDDREKIEEVLAQSDTKLMLLEAPTNPMLRIPDIAKLVALAKRHGVLVVLDNTFAGLHNHGQFEVDYYVHSLTKYAGGHGDTMGGIVIGSAERIRALKPLAVNMGSTLDPGAAFMLLRGLKTYYLRYRQHSANALAIAQYLMDRPEVASLRYPGLPADPEHALARRQMTDFGGVVTFDLKADKATTWRFIDALNVFATTASLGSTESLVAPVMLYQAGDLSADELERSRITDSTVRLAIGIEDVSDLIADLDQAFASAFR